MIRDWNADQIIAQCRSMYRATNDPYMTGWNNWPAKQDLYRVKFAVDEMLKDTGKFLDEDEWLEDQEKQRMWKALIK